MRIHKKKGEKQQVEVGIRLKSMKGKYGMYLQIEQKSMGSPWINS
jgi:hypothetical protein